jgi:hypothetical protein
MIDPHHDEIKDYCEDNMIIFQRSSDLERVGTHAGEYSEKFSFSNRETKCKFKMAIEIGQCFLRWK